jgi:hypothetical protein
MRRRRPFGHRPRRHFRNRTRLRRRHPVVHAPSGETAEGENGGTTVGKLQRFSLQTLLGEQATKTALIELLRAEAQPTPAVLVSGSHGMQFNLGDARQADAQGAIVCQDWIRSGPMKADDWLAAADVPDNASLQGMMHFFFACHGGGFREG